MVPDAKVFATCPADATVMIKHGSKRKGFCDLPGRREKDRKQCVFGQRSARFQKPGFRKREEPGNRRGFAADSFPDGGNLRNRYLLVRFPLLRSPATGENIRHAETTSTERWASAIRLGRVSPSGLRLSEPTVGSGRSFRSRIRLQSSGAQLRGAFPARPRPRIQSEAETTRLSQRSHDGAPARGSDPSSGTALRPLRAGARDAFFSKPPRLVHRSERSRAPPVRRRPPLRGPRRPPPEGLPFRRPAPAGGGGYLVDPASSICLSQRLSHASLSTHGRYSETANGSLNQLWFL